MLAIVVALLVFSSVSCLSLALFARPAPNTMEARITDFRTRVVAAERNDEVDLSVPFAERVIRPGMEGIAHAFSSVLPASMLSNIQQQITMAGNPMTLNAYVTFWLFCLVLFGAMALMMFLALPANMMMQKVGISFVFLAIGWIMPKSWLKGKVKTRQKVIVRALPDALDLITTCVEAGLGLDAALARVADKSEGPLAAELSRMLRDVAMGKMRREAMAELSSRVGVEELTSFVNSVIQAEQLGVGIAQVLRVQSDQLRTKRRQRAERTAHEAPIKMLFPLVFFIFPAFLIVILGPAVLRLAGSF